MRLAAATFLVALLLVLSPGRNARADATAAELTPASNEEISLPARTPEPIPMTCSAQLQCPSGGTVSCTGQSSCTVQSQWVTCDGHNWICPGACIPPGGCQDPEGYCECKAAGGQGPLCSRNYCI